MELRKYRVLFDTDVAINEDDLPEDMTMMDYHEWFQSSWVDTVRMGPPIEQLKPGEQP